MLDAKLLSSAKYKSLFERFDCEVVDDKLIYHRRDPDDILQEGQEVHIKGMFNFSNTRDFTKFMIEQYDRFNFDDLIEQIDRIPECKEYMAGLQANYQDVVNDVRNMTDDDLKRAPGLNKEEFIKYFSSRPASITSNSTNEEKLDYLFAFEPFGVIKQVTLDGKECLIGGSYPGWLIFNEQILNIFTLDDFEVDPDYCEWDYDEDDVIQINFTYKGE